MDIMMYLLTGSVAFIIGLTWLLVLLVPISLLFLILGVSPIAWLGVGHLERRAQSTIRVLVADDDSVSVAPLLAALSQFNVLVEVVSSGKEVIQKVKDGAYNLIFLDYQMPELTGIQTLCECDSKVGFKKAIPVVFFTGVIESLPKLVMNHFFVKDIWKKGISFDALSAQIQGTLTEMLPVTA